MSIQALELQPDAAKEVLCLLHAVVASVLHAASLIRPKTPNRVRKSAGRDLVGVIHSLHCTGPSAASANGAATRNTLCSHTSLQHAVAALA